MPPYTKMIDRQEPVASAKAFFGASRRPRAAEAGRFLRSLSCVLLALAICLWGYESKAASYVSQQHSASATSVAKLWLDSKSSRAAEPVQHAAPVYGQSDALVTRAPSVRLVRSLQPILSPRFFAPDDGAAPHFPSRSPPTLAL